MIAPRPLIGNALPNIKRLPGRRRMTIALGISTSEGIIIAADTEETGYFKRHQPKILLANIEIPDGLAMAGAAMAITGAGDADYLDAISEELKDCFFQHWREDSGSIEGAVKEQLHAFYEKHVIPFSGFPDADRPSLSLIIGMQKNGESRLFMTSKNAIRPGGAYDAVGVGAELAKTLLQRLYPRFPTLDVAEALAAYVAFQVKELIPGCGKDTTIVRLENDFSAYGNVERTRAMEDLFKSYIKVEREALGYIFGSPGSTFVKHIATSFKGIREKLASLFNEFPNAKIDTVWKATQPVPRKLKGPQ
jgi:20S proteasome alpha/beta subunit